MHIMTRILILNGHPDPARRNFCAALAQVYEEGAMAAGHETRRLDVGTLNLPPIHTAQEFAGPATEPGALTAQEAIVWCEHLVIIHPLWLGAAPAVLKGFFEQTFRYGFAIPAPGHSKGFPAGLLKGRSARTVVTMGMPGFVYRWMFGAFAVRAMERSMLRLSGFGPIRRSLIGGMGDLKPDRAKRLLDDMRRLGSRAS
jgi:putative NADPH-quinone reductase